MNSDQYLRSVYSAPWNKPGSSYVSSNNTTPSHTQTYAPPPAQENLFQHTFGTDLVSTLLAGILILLLLAVMARLLSYMRKAKSDKVYLQLTPQAFMSSGQSSSEQLLSVIHGLSLTQTWKNKLLRQGVVLSQELVSSRPGGIRYVAVVPRTLSAIYQRSIHAHLPDMQIEEIKDYLPKDMLSLPGRLKVLEFKQSRHYAYSLDAPLVDSLDDPMSFLTSSMTKLGRNEMMALQLVLVPVRSKSATKFRNKLVHLETFKKTNRSIVPLAWLTRLMVGLLSAALRLVMEFVSVVIFDREPFGSHQNKFSLPSPSGQKILEDIDTKLSKPLFRVSLRAVILSSSKKNELERVNSLKSALSVFAVPGLQGLKTSSVISIYKKYHIWQFQNRLPSLLSNNGCLLSTSELAAIYHFPRTSSSKTEDLVKSLSRNLPAPLSLKQETDFDVILGKNIYHDQTTLIGLTDEERERHVYIVGGTGNGKTTMLFYSILQDLRNGKGLAVVDPHGDLAKSLLRHIPKDRINDVVYLNPSDFDYPIGINLLELPKGLTGSELEQAKDLVTESVVSILRKAFSEEDLGGHRIEYVLRNAIHTAMTVEDATIFTVLKLLNDSVFRHSVIKNLEDEDLKSFWYEELGKAGAMQRVKMSAGVTAKIGRFRRSLPATRILSQAKSTIDFEDIMNNRKILICNFSRGKLGEDTSTLFGTTVLAKLQLAALKREDLDPGKRIPFYLYVDEFQNFATMPFLQMLSEARKYKLFLTMAEQSTAQQERFKFINVILANVGTVICFRTASPADENVLLPLFKPYLHEGEISSLPSYTFYARIMALKPQEPLSGQTILSASQGSESVAAKVIDTSRSNYAVAWARAKTTKTSKTKPEKIYLVQRAH